jgi:hypothetical protein
MAEQNYSWRVVIYTFKWRLWEQLAIPKDIRVPRVAFRGECSSGWVDISIEATSRVRTSTRMDDRVDFEISWLAIYKSWQGQT